MLLLIFTIFTVSCAGMKGITIESNPVEAEVFIYDNVQKKYLAIGKTPLNLSDEKLKEYKDIGKDFIALRIEKAGHIVEHIIYDVNTKTKINYLLEMKPLELWADKEGFASSHLANDIARKVQMINRDILKKDLEKALNRIDALIEIYPRAYVFYDMKGSIYLLKGNSQKALASLNQSLSIFPDNNETREIVKVLEKTNRSKN